MRKRTVINRTCKRLINTSSDAILMDDELLDEELPNDTAKVNLKAEKDKYANAKVSGLEELNQQEEPYKIEVTAETIAEPQPQLVDKPNF